MTAGTKEYYRSYVYTGSLCFAEIQLQPSQKFVMFEPYKISENACIKCFSGWCKALFTIDLLVLVLFDL